MVDYNNGFFKPDVFMEMFKKMTTTKMNFDRDELLKQHRSNVETLTEANKLAIEVLKSIAQLQTQYFKQAFEEFSQVMGEQMKSAVNHNTLQDNLKKPIQEQWKDHTDNMKAHSEKLKQQLEGAKEHGKKIVEKMTESTKNIHGLVKERMFQNGGQDQPSSEKKAKTGTKH